MVKYFIRAFKQISMGRWSSGYDAALPRQYRHEARSAVQFRLIECFALNWLSQPSVAHALTTLRVIWIDSKLSLQIRVLNLGQELHTPKN